MFMVSSVVVVERIVAGNLPFVERPHQLPARCGATDPGLVRRDERLRRNTPLSL
jgi:hypothetical protein